LEKLLAKLAAQAEKLRDVCGMTGMRKLRGLRKMQNLIIAEAFISDDYA